MFKLIHYVIKVLPNRALYLLVFANKHNSADIVNEEEFAVFINKFIVLTYSEENQTGKEVRVYDIACNNRDKYSITFAS
jgi:hypothetical protein